MRPALTHAQGSNNTATSLTGRMSVSYSHGMRKRVNGRRGNERHTHHNRLGVVSD